MCEYGRKSMVIFEKILTSITDKALQLDLEGDFFIPGQGDKVGNFTWFGES